MIFVVENEKELGEAVWREIKDKLNGGLVVGLQGDLGAGKTTLVREIARYLGVKDKVASPTFNLRKSYPVHSERIECLQHIDLYRIASPKQLDWEEVREWLVQKNCLTFVEWPENLPKLENALGLEIVIEPIDREKRKVELKWM